MTFVATVAADGCIDGVTVSSVEVGAMISGACVASGGMPTGEFTPTDPVSVCCL